MQQYAKCERLSLVADPRVGGDGIEVLAQWGVDVPARAKALFWDDPFGVGFRQPREIEARRFDGFLVALDRHWELDGHRSFVNSHAGVFMLDKVLGGSSQQWDRYLLTDRDTSLRGESDQTGTRPLEQKKPLTRLTGAIGVAVGAEPSNWGSFVARIIPKALLLRRLGAEKLLVYCRHPRQKELLELVGWAPENVIEFQPWRRYAADRMILPSEKVDGLYLSPDAAADLEGIGLRYRNASTPRRVFVSRRGGIAARSGRFCLNGEQVERAVQEIGFDLMIPDTLSVADQIAYFSGAEVIVGASGAGMFNTLFAPDNPWIVDIESQSNWLHGHNGLFAGAGLRYGFQIAEADPESEANHKPFNIHIDALVDRLKFVLKES